MHGWPRRPAVHEMRAHRLSCASIVATGDRIENALMLADGVVGNADGIVQPVQLSVWAQPLDRLDHERHAGRGSHLEAEQLVDYAVRMQQAGFKGAKLTRRKHQVDGSDKVPAPASRPGSCGEGPACRLAG